MRNEIALQVHLGRQGERDAALLPSDGDRVLHESACDLLRRQAILADLDEVVEQLDLLSAGTVIQADRQAIQPSGRDGG
jgi:S-adenosylmethionine:diacylglycerol 3-amino-3-carboxypropyl transferase